MNKSIMNAFLSAVCVFAITATVNADLSQFGGTSGWMKVYDNDGSGGQGGFLWESGWGIVDSQAITSDDINYELLPNINTYANNVANGSAGDIAYWTNSSDGGVTPGLDGNKFMEAITYREHTIGAGQTAADYSFAVNSNDLDSRYELQAFVKILNPSAGWATTHDQYETLSGVTSGTINIGQSDLAEGSILQVGFILKGLNANPDTDWGSASVTITDANVVPEPATMGLIGLFGGGMMALRRFRIC